MQVRNIALVDLTFLRPMEEEALDAYMERERTPVDILIPLSALSQMWIFSLYEFLRTWRQRADYLLRLAEGYEATLPDKRAEFIAEATQKLSDKRRLLRIGPEMYAKHLEQFADPTYVAAVRNYRETTDWVFREAEALRVTLAKHEVPKTPGLFAEAPGYGRMNYRDGSMYWFINLKDESTMKIDRRLLGNAFLGFDDEPI
jgi:hypothetical protein